MYTEQPEQKVSLFYSKDVQESDFLLGCVSQDRISWEVPGVEVGGRIEQDISIHQTKISKSEK